LLLAITKKEGEVNRRLDDVMEREKDVKKQKAEAATQCKRYTQLKRKYAKTLSDLNTSDQKKGSVFACRHCEKLFFHQSSLSKHQKNAHPGIKRESKMCKNCGKSFSSAGFPNHIKVCKKKSSSFYLYFLELCLNFLDLDSIRK
jgi:hypothetical protein